VSETDNQQRVADLEKVLAISRSMAATDNLDALLQLVIDCSMDLLGAERATIFLYDSTTDELVSKVAAGGEEIRISADTGIAGAAARGGKVVNVAAADADPRWNPEVDRKTGFKTRNILSVPLWGHRGRLVGVLQVLNKHRGAFGEYDVTMSETFAAQAGVAIQRANLIEHYLEKLEMERAMEIARDIQQGLLPTGRPDIEGFDVAGFSKPADETGGDTYDFMLLPSGRWMFAIADATGHGIGPAIVIAETRAMLRAMFLQAGQGADESGIPSILETCNDLLVKDLDGARFVTCFLGVLDVRRQCLTFASAGHGPMIFYNRDADAFETMAATAVPLGVLPDTDYSGMIERHMACGDLMAVVTDGFLEATNDRGEEFGVDRACRLFRERRDCSPKEMITALNQAVMDFTKAKPQADDLTAVIIRKE